MEIFTVYSKEDVEPLLKETADAVSELRKWIEQELNK